MKLEPGKYYEIITNPAWNTKVIARFESLVIGHDSSSNFLVFTVTSTDNGIDEVIEIPFRRFQIDYVVENRVIAISDPSHEDSEEF